LARFSQRARWTYTLLLLYKLKGPSERFGISTTKLARLAGMSQQNASRIIVELEREGFIKRERSGGKTTISLTGKALSEVEGLLAGLLPHINPSEGVIAVTGSLFSGMGEGAYYMAQRGYSSQFYQALGFQPYPGTLNLRLTDSKDIMSFTKLLAQKPHVIKGFSGYDREFGDVLAYPVTIEGKIKGAVVRSLRTVYDATVAELIAPVYLRKELHLKDGDRVTFSYG
jgi:riboflavin kinase